jgi:hypothetical protein
VFLQAAVLFLTDIAFALPAFAAIALSVRAVVITRAVVLIIFAVCIKCEESASHMVSGARTCE